MTFYAFGEPFRPGIVSDKTAKLVLKAAWHGGLGLVLTTYEASRAYLDQLLKQEGPPLRDLYREMCMILVLTPKDRDIVLLDKSTETVTALKEGEA
jgi:hypothetical protein